MATLAASGSLTAAWNGSGVAPAGSVVQLTTADATSVGVEITGTFVASVVLEATLDGSTWFAVNPFNIAGSGVSATITAPGRCVASVADFVQVRARCSAFTSGAAVVTMDGSAAAGGGGGSGGGGGGAVTIVDGGDTALGTTSDAGIITNIAGTVIGFLRGSIIQWAAFLARFPAALGGTTAANSLPVTLSSDGPFVSQTGSITETAPATDTASSGLNGRLQRVAQRLTSLIALLPAALGSATAANSLPVTLSTDGQFTTSTGSLTETAPATDTASSGLNGRLQRVAQRLSSLIALLPTALISNRLDVNLGAAPAFLSAGGAAPAAPTCVFTRGANTTAYTIGDEVGTASTAPTTVSVARVNGGSGVILGAQAVYSNYPAIVPSLVLLVFSATVTLAGDNAQLALSDADAAKLLAAIPLTATQALNYSAGAAVSSGALYLSGAPSRPAPHFVTGGSEQTLYCCLITLNAFTPIANSETVTIMLDVEQN